MRADRPERRGQDHAAGCGCCPGWPGRRRRDVGAGQPTPPGPGIPGRGRLPGPGDPAVPAVHRRGAHQHRRAPEPPLGRGAGARPAEVAEDPAGPRGGLAVRGPASPARADAHAGQEAQAGAAGRTRRRAGPAGPAAFPGHHGRRRRRGRADCRAVLAPGRGHGAGRRPPHPAGGFPRAAIRRHRRPAGRASRPGEANAPGHRRDRQDAHHRAGRAHPRQTTLLVRGNAPGDRPGMGKARSRAPKRWCWPMGRDAAPRHHT